MTNIAFFTPACAKPIKMGLDQFVENQRHLAVEIIIGRKCWAAFFGLAISCNAELSYGIFICCGWGRGGDSSLNSNTHLLFFGYHRQWRAEVVLAVEYFSTESSLGHAAVLGHDLHSILPLAENRRDHDSCDHLVQY